jgi:hypothetical protein
MRKYPGKTAPDFPGRVPATLRGKTGKLTLPARRSLHADRPFRLADVARTIHSQRLSAEVGAGIGRGFLLKMLAAAISAAACVVIRLEG